MASFTPLSKHLWTLLSPKGCPLSITCRRTAESFTEELALLRWSMCLRRVCFASSVNKSLHFSNYITQFSPGYFIFEVNKFLLQSAAVDLYILMLIYKKVTPYNKSIDFIFFFQHSTVCWGSRSPSNCCLKSGAFGWFSYRGKISHHLEREIKNTQRHLQPFTLKALESFWLYDTTHFNCRL